jgi:hypothetical protein
MQAQGELSARSTSWKWASTQLRRSTAKGLLHRLIELTETGEASRKGNGRQRKTRLVDEQASCLSASAPSQGKWTNSHLCHQFAM